VLRGESSSQVAKVFELNRRGLNLVRGAILAVVGFGIGGGAWGWVVLAAFVVTVLGGLAVKYGLHSFVAAYLLNAWFIIVLGLPTLGGFDVPTLFRSGPIHTYP